MTWIFFIAKGWTVMPSLELSRSGQMPSKMAPPNLRNKLRPWRTSFGWRISSQWLPWAWWASLSWACCTGSSSWTPHNSLRPTTCHHLHPHPHQRRQAAMLEVKNEKSNKIWKSANLEANEKQYKIQNKIT